MIVAIELVIRVLSLLGVEFGVSFGLFIIDPETSNIFICLKDRDLEVGRLREMASGDETSWASANDGKFEMMVLHESFDIIL